MARIATNERRLDVMRPRRFLCVLCALCGSVVLLPLLSDAQTNRFFYDNLGRIAVVIATNSTDAALYKYDAVGNITSIVRQTVGPVNLFTFSPVSGSGNESVILQGTGFGAIAASNTVKFGTIAAQVITSTVDQITVLVPTNAVSSLISVVVSPSGGSTNSTTFTVGLGVQVSPNPVAILGGSSTQFVATVVGTNNQSVTWLLQDWIAAGSNTVWGIVTTNGSFTAPIVLPPAGFASVQARSVFDPDPLNEGTVIVTITPPPPPIASFIVVPPTNGFMPFSVTFSATSTGAVLTNIWTFGDGTTNEVTSTNNIHNAATNIVHSFVVYPPGDVSVDTKVTTNDSFLINEVLVGNLTTNDVVFQTNFTAQLTASNPQGGTTTNCPNCIIMGTYPNGDVNTNAAVSSADSLLISQVMSGLRSHITTKIVPGVGTSSVPTTVTLYGIGFTTGTVSSVQIGAPVNLTLSNVVAVSAEKITGIVPAGGGAGTGVVSVTATPSNAVINYATYINQ